MSTKQIHPYVRKSQQAIKSIIRHSKYKNTCRRRAWWKAWHRRYWAEWEKEQNK